MLKLSVAIIVQNEEKNLPRWIKSVAPVADEIVAVDSGSSDRTVELLEQAGAKVFHRAWTGYADQRNFLAEKCGGDWILMLDADEVINDQCAAVLRGFKANPEPEVDGYQLPSRVWFFGHRLRWGGFYQEWNLRLYRRNKGRWARQEVHERLEVEGEVGRLDTCLYDHHSYDSVEDYRQRTVRYAEAGARAMLAAGRGDGKLSGALHAAWNFFNRYLLHLGFLDGAAGWHAARMEAVYTWKKYSRLAGLRAERKGG
ncbi:MAG: glycosyltransferase family 2 protein [Desulfarculaceae bacterium]|nr:glycosyltransferase family 2 protein [Desulfarculaceae bacterium]MCF8074189.1 glycosyltransferase family 2 protein [Desulfarculaceae bacterium]MCF8102770.1 glycosyltransferase family 2 protein [Desulfarculaceae bacterium]MCF8116375.1 glycosyltransferase family 2 protein [Desulfarculaceae bacterium]